MYSKMISIFSVFLHYFFIYFCISTLMDIFIYFYL